MDNEEKVSCVQCSGEYSLDDTRLLDNEIVCLDCSYYCDSCSTLGYKERSIYSENHGSLYCNECAIVCERCNDGELRDDYRMVSNNVWCEPCADNNSFYCAGCQESHSDEYDSHYVSDDALCDSCYDDSAYYCNDCEEAFYDDNPCDCSSNGGTSNRLGCCGNRGFIHQYSCKPEVNFIGESKRGLFFGFELETQIRTKDNNGLEGASEYASNALKDIAILKHDSSIGRDGYSGFEIVTQPHTHTQYRDNSQLLWDTIDKLRTDYEARSWDTTTCGLHIHISRAGFSSGAHLHRFISLVYHNAEMMMKFAGRKSDYARFNDVYTFNEFDKPVFSLKHKVGDPRQYSSERMSAVNTQNRTTIELRFFRGTMNPKGVLSALDLAHSMVEYTRELRLDEVKLGALSWEWFSDYVESNNGLYPDLYQRLGKVASTNLSKPTTINA